MFFKVFFAFILSLPLVVAADTDSSTSVWLMTLSRLKFSDNIIGYVDVQPRFTLNDISRGEDNALDTLLLRGALGYQITPNVGLYQGYAYIPTYDPKRVEHRAFQELLINHPLEIGGLTHRLRFEQRFLDVVDDTSYRFRYFARYVRPLQAIHAQLSLAINEEVMINLNDVEKGPQSGFNQNRLFLGFNYKTSPTMSFDVGYQNQVVNILGGRNNVMNHILFFGVIANFSLLN